MTEALNVGYATNALSKVRQSCAVNTVARHITGKTILALGLATCENHGEVGMNINATRNYIAISL